jgi:hypothetical protein
MDRLKELDARLRAAQGKMAKLADERALEIVREVDRLDAESTSGRGGAARVAETLKVTAPTITHAIKRGRALLAKKAAREKGSAAAA